jgi:hypothetical protein
MIRLGSRDIDFLKTAGVAQTTKIGFSGGELTAIYVETQFRAFHLLNQANPGMWTLGQQTKDFFGLPGGVTRQQIAEISLNSVLPIPPDDIPLADILELKSRRKNEFRALRVAVDELNDDMQKAVELPRGESAAVQRLQTAINDIRKIAHSSWLDRIKSFLKFDFAVHKAAVAGSGGYWLGEQASIAFGLPGLGAAGAAVAAALSPISFTAKIGTVLADLPRETRNYACLDHVEREFPGTLGRDASQGSA